MAKKAKPIDVDDDKSKGEKARKDKLLKRALERYKVLEDFWAENRKLAVEDIKFAAGDQWPEHIKKAREKKKRPALVLDKLAQYRRQVVNDGRQNRPSIKFRPVDGGDVAVATAFQGITRAILNRSNADEAFDTALDHACGHGFGYFRVLTDYVHPGSFEQDIKVVRVRNSLAVLLAPHQAADGSDAEDGFVIDTMPKTVFEQKWPKAEKDNWADDATLYGDGWLDEEHVRVAEYWYKEPTERTLYQLDDGTTVFQEDYDKSTAELASVGLPPNPVVNQRVVIGHKVKWCRMTGAEILEEREWAGQYIPIIPVYGTETDVNGKVTYSGLTRPGKSGQMLYNFARTAFAERVALTPKAPWVAAAGQTEEHPEWLTANEDNHPVLTYDPIDVNGQTLPAPQRQPASDIPAGFAQEMQQAEHDIQSAIGMYAASLGQQSNEKSGRAIMARQREGDVATFHYHDNLNRAIRHLGRILLDLIPKIYDSKRVVRLLNEDGTTKDAYVNPELPTPTAKYQGMEVYNLGAGVYDVETESGPSYTTKRIEAAESMMEIAKGNPSVWNTHGDLIVKAMDWPGADDFAKRTKALMPPEMLKAIEASENEDGPDPKIQQIVQAAEQEIQMREEALQRAAQKVQELEAELKTKQEMAEAKEKEVKVKEQEAEIKAYDAETKRVELLMPFMTAAQLAMLTTQTSGQATTPEDLVSEYSARKAMEMPVPSEMPAPSEMPMQPEVQPEVGQVPAEPVQKEPGIGDLIKALMAPRRRSMQRPDGTVLTVMDEPMAMEAPQNE